MIFGLEPESILHWVVLIVGFYMAWNIGANDVSNAMGTSVGSGALTLRKAVLIAAVLEFCGAYFVGASVSETMQHGLVDPSFFAKEPLILIIGMCGALLGTGLWLQIASYFGWPVSTTHAIVGSIIGFGIVGSGWDAVLWEEVGFIALSWVISPFLSAIVSYLIFSLVQKKILYALNPIEAAWQIIPFFYFIVFSTFTLSLVFNGLQNFQMNVSFPYALCLALGVGLIGAFIGYLILRFMPLPRGYIRSLSRVSYAALSLDKAMKHLQRVRASAATPASERISEMLREMKGMASALRQESSVGERSSEYSFVEKMFVYLQILSASYVAFAHGANDVANAIGPVAAALDVIKNGALSATSIIPPWLLVMGGAGIVLGLATWGWRVIETIGKKITELTPTRGFCAEFGAATTILVASKLGLPVSTTHCLVGSVLGVGLARGLSALNLSMLREIVLSWVVTIPASAFISILCFYLLKAIFVTQ